LIITVMAAKQLTYGADSKVSVLTTIGAGLACERETHTRQRERQTDRGAETDRQTDKETERQRERGGLIFIIIHFFLNCAI